MSHELLLAVDHLRVEALRPGGPPRTIVSELSFALRAGETLAIVGESGSGKSMTAKAIMGLLPSSVRASGRISYEGRHIEGLGERERARLRGRDIGMVFQDPFTMLNPVLRVGHQVLESVRGPGGRRLRGSAARAEAERRLAEVGIRDPAVVDRYPFQLSGGMRQRVGIAAALAADPKLLIADEPSTALDVTTQKEILDLLLELQRRRGMAFVLITHDLRVAFSVCTRVLVLYAGRCLETGSAADLEAEPRHPYTLGLLLSEPEIDRRTVKLEAIGGNVPRPDEVAAMCAFAPRCRWVDEPCRAGAPALAGDGHLTACLRWPDIAVAMTDARAAARAQAEASREARDVDALLHVEDVRKTFPAPRRGGETVAVESASFTVGAGEIVGLVGESGSGKTTVARCVMGLETPTSGRIVLDGVVAAGADAPDRATRARIRRTAQMVFQDPYSTLNPKRTVEATLIEALRLSATPPANLSGAVDGLLDRVGVPRTYRRRRPAALSGGERQRVAIARALAVEPRLLVCDEPVSALDVSIQAQILNLITHLRDELGVAVLLITHDLAIVRQVVDRVYVMQAGRIVESGPTGRVLDHPHDPYTRRLMASIPRPRGDDHMTATPTNA
jgi:peptide/nickel transport system ATP-binding protein